MKGLQVNGDCSCYYFDEERLVKENARYEHTKGVSQNNRGGDYIPAFKDTHSGEVFLSRFKDGSLAPLHLLDGLPIRALDVCKKSSNPVYRLKKYVVSGFFKHGEFFTRSEMAGLH